MTITEKAQAISEVHLIAASELLTNWTAEQITAEFYAIMEYDEIQSEGDEEQEDD